jgi:secA-related protein
MRDSKKVPEKRSRDDIISDIKLLVATKGYIFVLAEIVSRDFFVDTQSIANIDWRERLHSNEVAYLMGLMLKNKAISFDEIDKEQIEEAIKYTRLLLEELHGTYMYDFSEAIVKHTPEKIEAMSDKEKEEEFREVFSSKEMIIGNTFYGDKGFYDVQLFEMAQKLYAQDEDWVRDNTKFSITKSKTMFFSLKNMFNSIHLARSILTDKQAESLRAMDEMAFPFDLIVKTIQTTDKSITEEDIQAFLDLFSCSFGDQPKTFNEPGDENIFTYKPIINLGNDIYFFPNTMVLASAIYKSPLYWMRQDEQYVNTANKHIGEVAEDITYDYFKSIFGEANTHKAVKITKGKKDLTDIDVMGIIGNTVIIAQNKSKKMTAAALNGDVDAIKSDFQKAVIDPYEQGIKVRDVLLGNESYKLIDKSGKQVTPPENIKHAYILCVSNEPYPAVMDQMRAFLVDVDQLPPIQLSLFDLDLMAEYLKDPYEFAFYIKQRLENHEGIISSNEIIHLAYHLRCGLFMPGDSDMLALDQSFGRLIDADYYHKKMCTPKPKKEDALFNPWQNKDFKKLVNTIKQMDDPSVTDIVFFLMTIPHSVIDALMKQIEKVNTQAKKDGGKLHDFSAQITNNEKPWGGITYVTGCTTQDIIPRLHVISSMNKYRAKAGAWLALCADSSVGDVQYIVFSKEPWVQSKGMDEALEFYAQNAKGCIEKINYGK